MRDVGGKTGCRLYGLGLGPGDPELVTLKALRILQEADVVFVPRGKKAEESVALRILTGLELKLGVLEFLEFPMSKDESVLHDKWTKAAEAVLKRAGENRTLAFVTLGDPGIYSTWTYLKRAIEKIAPSITCVAVPGIQTMNAAAAEFCLSLTEGNEGLALLPVTDVSMKTEGRIQAALDMFDTVVFYKIGEKLSFLRNIIDLKGLSENAWFAKRVGLDGSLFVKGISTLPAGVDGYLSVMIVKKGGRE